LQNAKSVFDIVQFIHNNQQMHRPSYPNLKATLPFIF